MFVLSGSLFATIIGTPVLAVSSALSKLYSIISGNEPMDISRKAFLQELITYVKTKQNRIKIQMTCNKSVIVLCRYATVFSGFPPVVILHGTNSGSFNYVDFMESFPKTHDVYCIDLPGWGISDEPPNNISSTDLDDLYRYYGNLVMTTLAEIGPIDQFTFVGHSFGSFLLVKMIENGTIPEKNIYKCVLTCLPGLAPYTSKYNYLWGTFFIYGLAESPFKYWWSKYLFRSWLFRGNKTPLEILQRTHRFISYSSGYKLLSRQMTFRGILPPIWKTLVFDEVERLSDTIPIKLINGTHDTLVDVRHARYLSEHSSIKLYEFNCGHSVFTQPELFSGLVKIIEYPNYYIPEKRKKTTKK
jgi:pimeloyl-ACP methyl ester carboxylesterase